MATPAQPILSVLGISMKQAHWGPGTWMGLAGALLPQSLRSMTLFLLRLAAFSSRAINVVMLN